MPVIAALLPKVIVSDSSTSALPTWISIGGSPAGSARTGEVKVLSDWPPRQAFDTSSMPSLVIVGRLLLWRGLTEPSGHFACCCLSSFDKSQSRNMGRRATAFADEKHSKSRGLQKRTTPFGPGGTRAAPLAVPGDREKATRTALLSQF